MFLENWLSNLWLKFTLSRPSVVQATRRKSRHSNGLLILHTVESLELRVLPAATITVVNVDSLVNDADSDGEADPGDQIHYTVTVSNSGDATATGLTFQEIINDPNLTLVGGSVNVSPLAINDTFTAVANTQLVVGTATPLAGPHSSVAGNVLANDTEFLSDTFTISTFEATSAQGGAVSLVTSGVNAGSFTYVPQAGDTGTDTFTYTLTDDGIDGIAGNADDLTSVGTVTITIGTNEVWYVDSSFGGTSTGTSTNPYKTLADVSGASGADGAGDIVYLRTGSGDYTGGMTLLANETLWGENETLIVDGFTLQAAGTDPVITNAAGDGVTLATENTLKGLTVSNSSGVKIKGTSVGTVTFGNVVLAGTGAAMNINGGTLAGTIDSLSATGPNNNSVVLNNLAGSLAISAGTIDGNNNSDDFVVIGGDAIISYAGSITNDDAHSVNIQNRTGGSVTFSGNITDTGGGIYINGNTGGTINFSGASKSLTSTSTELPVQLTNNTGATINFSGGGLVIASSTATGFSATGGGTVSVTGTGNTINSTNATALNVANTTISASELTFQSISAGNNDAGADPASGIILNNTGSSGGLTVTGTDGADGGTVPDAGTGGTIQRTTSHGISLTSTQHVRLGGMNIINNLGSGISGSTINGFLLDGVTITGNGNDAATDESGINVTEVTGSAFGGARPTGITNSTISNNNEFEVQITNTSGTLTDFRLTTNTISSDGLPINGNGSSPHGNLVNFLALGSANMTLNASGGNYTGNWNPASPPTTIVATGIQADHSGTSGTVTANILSASFTNLNVGPQVSNSNGGSLVFDFSDNTVTGIRSSAINLFNAASATGTVVGQFVNNTVGTLGVTGSGASLGFPIRVQNEGAANTTLLIQGNTLQESESFAGINFNIGLSGVATQGGTQNLTILDNIIREIDNSRAIIINQNQESPATPAPTTFVNISGNSFSNVAGQAGDGSLIRLRESSAGTFKMTQKAATAAADPVGPGADPGELDDANGFNDPAKIFISGAGIIDYNQGTPPVPLFFAPSADDVVLPAEGDADSALSSGADADAPVDESFDGDSTVQTPVIVDDGILSQDELNSLVVAAITRWEATGLTAEQVSLLQNVTFTIEDLPGWYLGQAAPGIVTLDANAAGNAWFIDATPTDDSEFTGAGTDLHATATGGAAGRVDALTTILHELGHQLGLDDTYASADSANLMYGWVQQSERRLPAARQAESANPNHLAGQSGPDFLFGSMNLGSLPAGKSLTIVYDATVNSITNGVAPIVTSQVRILGDGGINVLSDDPAVAGAANPTATAIDGITLGNLVWGDTDGDGIFTETGINGVTVNLYVDVNMNDVLDVGDGAAIATTTTAGGGLYSFSVLPGEYLVEVAASNFQVGGALLGKLSSGGVAPDPDNNVNNDDNGVNNSDPATNGISSLAITLNYNTEPTADGTGQFDINNTLDFGFSDRPNVQVTKTDGVTTAVPGQSVTYTITVSNTGELAATGASVTDSFPAEITSAIWTSVAVGGATGNTASSSGNISQTLDLPAGSSVTYTVTANISASSTGSLVNTATVSHADDTSPGDNSATDTDTLTPQTNVGVTKMDGVTTVVPGQSTTYTIVVSNTGPSVATSTTFTDNFPAGINSATWTSVAAGGATGNTASSSGNISQTLNLPVGSSVTYTVTAGISASATGSLVNTATVSQVNDTNGGNNSATDTDTLTPQTDVSVTKTDGVTNATPGSTTTYTIVVSNSGPSTAVSTTFTDNFPAAITSANWTSVAAGGATGNTASSSGNIAQTLTLPPGATVTYTVTANISSGATGNLVNTATVSQANDLNLGNNSATDTDTLGNPVSITKILDGAEPSTNGKFRVSQLQATGTDTVVTYTVTGTAADGSDFTSLTGSVTITAGDTSADIDVFTLDDSVVEGDETVVVTLTGFTQNDQAIILDPVLANRTATVDIADDDTNTLSISAPLITETNADQTVTFTVASPVAVQGGFDVEIGNLNGTADSSDYTLDTITVHFNGTAGETQSVSVTIKGDTVVEANETFQILLGSVSSGTLSQAALITAIDTALGTINNDDTNLLSISAPVITETNADQLVTFTVTSPNAVEGGFDVAISSTNGTAGASDYSLVTTTVHFSGTPGETQSVSVTIKGDTHVEANETFNVVLGTVSGTTATQSAAITSGASAIGTINNDDSNLVVIDAPLITETNADQVVTFTVKSFAPVEGGFDVAISTTDGTAGASDYALVTTTVHFNGTANETQLVSVTIQGDTIVEANETFNVVLGTVSGTTATQIAAITSGAPATGTINNDDTNLLAISAPLITETNADQLVTFTVTSPNAVEGGFDVAISTTDGTAGSSDYALVTTTVHFNGTAGETQLVSVTIKGDTSVEANETFNVVLGTVSGTTAMQIAAITSGASATGTIINDDANLLSISAPVITETNADQLVTFTVTSPNAVEGGFDVAISTTDGTAGSSDYALVTTTVHFNGTAGETQLVSVTIKGDTIVEANETFDVVLGTVSGTTATQIAAIISGASATGTINNDDTNLLAISAPLITETNADQTVTFTVTSPNAVEGGFDVAISTTNGTAVASDLSLVTTTVHFNGTAGETQLVSVTIKGDTSVEANETFNVVLGTVSGTTATQIAAITSGASATGTITNDDTNVLSISAPVITETNADQLVTFTVTSPNAVEGGFDVAISTANGTAGASDFSLVTTTVHFNGTAGETQLVSVTIKGDTIVEANETFNVVLGTVSGTTATQIAAITSGAVATGTINNDDTNLLSISPPIITETNGDQTVTFTVTSTNAVEGGFDVAISAADGTAESSDYALVTTTIHFTGNANETQSVSVTIKGDAVVEANETFSVTLGTVSNSTATQIAAITSGATATGTINNDDSNILTVSGPASITETNVDQTATFTITSPTAVQGGFDVAITTNDGTARGGDYALVTTTVHFNGTVGESHSVNVTIKGDTIVEANETFTVLPGTVSGTSSTQAAAITGTGVIATINNDDVNTLSISAPAITESNGDQIVTFTVTSPNAVEGGFDVALSTTDGTAGSGDYALVSTSVHFNGTVGESQLVSVTIKGDTVVEANETFSVNLGAVSNTTATQIAAITTGASANATINNDDTNTLSISAPVITETNVDQTVKFTVTSPNAVQGGFDVAISAANGTAGSSDYALVTTTVHFTGTAGETQLVSVTIKGDTQLEVNETFQVSTGAVSGTTATQQAAITSGATATGIILNDDVDTLTISAPVITETNGDQIVTFTVTSPTAVPGGFDVALKSTDGTAGSGDYALLTTSLHFNGTANETLSVSVRIKGDINVEDHETFRIGFGTVSGTTPTQASAIITTNFATGTIQNDDSSRLSISAPVITETNGDQVVTFSVTSSNAVEGGFDVAIGSASGTATSNDFALVTKSIHFNGTAGETQLVSVTIKGDTIVESDETFRVILGGVSRTTETQRLSIVTGASATATIVDDDVAPLSISAPVINETTSIPRRVNFPTTNSTVQFTVTSPSAVPGGFDVAILTSNGTADSADYSLVTKKVHFQGTAGETRTITVEIVADTIVEDDETFTLTLGAISNTTAAQQAKITTGASATGVIIDDDRQTLIIEAPTITESNSDQIVTFTITSLNAVQGGFDLDLSTLNGTADSSDYSLVTTKVHFTGVANEKQLVQVTIKGDTLLEANETFKVVLGAVSNTSAKQKASISTGASVTGTIKNDDRAASANKVARQALSRTRHGG